ncbi:MAG: tetratricopeptide repeat protein [Nitrosomonas sp.]
MKKAFIFIIVLFGLTCTPFTWATERFLQGRVSLVGDHDEPIPLVGQDVLIQFGNPTRTKEGGLFRLFLPNHFQAGSKITLVVEKAGWRIQYPLEGEVIIPDELEKVSIDIRMLPVGSKKFWSHDRMEKFIQDVAEKAKQQVQPQGKPQDIDLSRYIKEWALRYGFSVQQAKAEIDKWATEVEQQNDPYQLGLAAFARKNFGEASQFFAQSAQQKAQAYQQALVEAEQYRADMVRDYRLAGDAAYSNYQFAASRSHYENALRHIDKVQQPQLWGVVQNEIGIVIRELAIRTEGNDIHTLFKQAVQACREALTVQTREALPQDWAMTQNNLGNVLRDQGIRTQGEARAQLLQQAVQAYREALTVRTREALPQQWAMTQNNLGNVLSDQGIRTQGEAGTGLLKQAVQAYREALTVRTREALPQDWAATQNNLGIVLREQGIRTQGEAGTQLLSQAVQAYREALTIYTREALPQQWAMTQNNLGAVLWDQGIRTPGEAGTQLLQQVVQAFREALTVYTREALPQDWAMTQNNLGLVLRDQGTRTPGETGTGLLQQAVQAYREALTVYTREALPQQRAATQNNLGNVLGDQGIRAPGEAGTQLLKQAVQAYREALTVRTREALPQQWAMTQNNLGNVLRDQGIRTPGEVGTGLLKQAEQAYREALAVRTREALPQQWTMTQNNLGLVLRDQGIRTQGEAGTGLLQQATQAYREVLEVDPDNELSYQAAAILYQEILFAFHDALTVHQQWLQQHPDDLSARANFAEAHFTTGRFAEAEQQLAALMTHNDLEPGTRVGLQGIRIANWLALHEIVQARVIGEELLALLDKLPADFEPGWSFTGAKYYVSQEPQLAAQRTVLLDLLTALEEKDAVQRRRTLESVMERIKAMQSNLH